MQAIPGWACAARRNEREDRRSVFTFSDAKMRRVGFARLHRLRQASDFALSLLYYIVPARNFLHDECRQRHNQCQYQAAHAGILLQSDLQPETDDDQYADEATERMEDPVWPLTRR